MAQSHLVNIVSVLAVAALAGAASDAYHRDHVRFHLFTKNTAASEYGTQISEYMTKQEFLDAGFNPALPTKVIIHGFSNSIHSKSIQMPKNAYFKIMELNVLAVDWSDLDPMPLYFAGVGNSRGVALRVAEVLDWMLEWGLISLEKLHIIGHSLGAHVAGMTSENMKSGKPARITGLDPARPFINFATVNGRLSPDDAKLVDAIHTNAGKLGAKPAVGIVDFYPNGGSEQPGVGFDFTGAKSHGRAVEFFTESISNARGFPAWICDDEWDALHKTCEKKKPTAFMGDQVYFKENGCYYLETNAKSPFSQLA